jgi:hypothetical protein
MALVNYDFDFTKMIKNLLPVKLRTTIRTSWLKASLSVVRSLHDQFLSFRANIMNAIIWNGQTIKLQQLLILKYGAGIFITNNTGQSDIFFVGDGIDSSAFIGDQTDVIDFIDISYSVYAYNFTVHVPVAITFNASEMQGLINRYKMFGTTYNIVTF